MIPIPIWALPTALLAMLLFGGGTGFLGYERGKDDQAAYQTKIDLQQAQRDLADHKKNDKIADQAGQKFEAAKPQIVKEVHDRVTEIRIPPDADPFVPVWFVRMFDRLASGDRTADTYPGQPDGAASRTRLSGTRPVLEAWVTKYETCRRAVDGIRELNPVLPKPPEAKKGFFDQINPF